MPPQAPSLWLLGSCGFVGRRLAALYRGPLLGIDLCPDADLCGDAAEPALYGEALRRLRPELAVLALSTRGGDAAAYRRCYVEALRALYACQPSLRVIFCSSISVYGDEAGRLWHESDACAAPTERSRILREAEELVLARDGLVLRLAPLYGVGRCELLRRHLAGEPRLPGPATRVLNYLYEPALTGEILCLAGDLSQRGIRNLCTDAFTQAEIYARLEAWTGLPAAAAESSPSRRGAVASRVLSAMPSGFFEGFVRQECARLQASRKGGGA